MGEHELDAVEPRPSRHQAEWRAALDGHDGALLAGLVEREPPGVALFTLVTYVNGLYATIQPIPLLAEVSELADFQRAMEREVRARVARALPLIAELRRRLGSRQRDFDIGLLRWMRRSSCLAVVLGAGVTMDAGGPSWSELVELLLERLLDTGHEIRRLVPPPGANAPFSLGPDGNLVITVPEEGQSIGFRLVSEVERERRFSAEDECTARRLLERVRAGQADTQVLLRAAQLCLDLAGQELFQRVSMAIYARAPRPGEIHRAIAELADGQAVHGLSGIQPGWDAIISYNFDNLMGEALAERGIPYIAWAMTGRGRMADGPRELVEPHAWHQPIYYLHGYTPARPFRITDTEFVFAASQFASAYGDPSRDIVRIVLDQHLARPVHLALYVGCSFSDTTMNDLLKLAAERYPGRNQYAVLKWPGAGRVEQATAAELAEASASYLDTGVQPLWVDDYAEIPALIRQLR